MPEKRLTTRYDFVRRVRREAGISSRTSRRLRAAFTITELVTTMLVVVIIVSALGVALVGGVRGWQVAYNRTYSDVVTGGYIARKTFDTLVRRASRQYSDVDDAGRWLEVYHFEGGGSTPVIDSYVRLYLDGAELKLEYGSLIPERKALGTKTVCTNVSSCFFKTDFRSAQMILELDNGLQRATVTSSAVMHSRE